MKVTPVIILCGGKGTRMGLDAHLVPKPLMPIGDRPILWHIMKIFAHQGFHRFILCLGHLGDQIRDYVRQNPEPGWEIELVETGLDTNTGGRIRRAAHLLGDGLFLATYADGVADVSVDELLRFHRGHGRLATITVVRPRVPFGLVELGGQREVIRFREKPHLQEWVNGGFFVFEPGVLEYLGTDSVLEREPFERLAQDGQLMAYTHKGFWVCMDTYKENLELNRLWELGRAGWKVWTDG